MVTFTFLSAWFHGRFISLSIECLYTSCGTRCSRSCKLLVWLPRLTICLQVYNSSLSQAVLRLLADARQASQQNQKEPLERGRI